MEVSYDTLNIIMRGNKAAFFLDQITYEEYVRVQEWAEDLVDSGYFKGKVL